MPSGCKCNRLTTKHFYKVIKILSHYLYLRPFVFKYKHFDDYFYVTFMYENVMYLREFLDKFEYI